MQVIYRPVLETWNGGLTGEQLRRTIDLVVNTWSSRMGTSGSFGGSGGRDAADLRDSIADWLDDSDARGTPTDDSPATDRKGEPGADAQDQPGQRLPIDIGPCFGSPAPNRRRR